jgi:hypothetical protein
MLIVSSHHGSTELQSQTSFDQLAGGYALMSQRLLGISAPRRARLSRWNNPAAGGYWCWGQMDTPAPTRSQYIALARARSRSNSRLGARGSLRLPLGLALHVPVQPSRSRGAPPVLCWDPSLSGDICTLPSRLRVRWCYLPLKPGQPKRRWKHSSRICHSTQVQPTSPVDADQTRDEDTNSLACMSRRG